MNLIVAIIVFAVIPGIIGIWADRRAKRALGILEGVGSDMSGTSQKKVASKDQYTFEQTDYLTIKTADGWFYRFTRPEGDGPYRFEKRRDPDGVESPKQNFPLPDAVVDYLQEHPSIDVTGMPSRPSSVRRDGGVSRNE